MPDQRPLPRLQPVGRAATAAGATADPAVGPPAGPPTGVVLVLHGGRSRGRDSGERKRLTYWRMVPFARMLARAGAPVYLLRYRYRGWNAPACDALRDAEWAVREIGRRHPGAPIALLGHSMGGRAALGAAGGPGVVAVCALAPWLDASDPTEQLADRSVLVLHGDRERWTDPEASYAHAVRTRRVSRRVARFEIAGAGHFMIARYRTWRRLVRGFVLGELAIEPVDPLIANAMQRPTPEGLRMAVPAVH